MLKIIPLSSRYTGPVLGMALLLGLSVTLPAQGATRFQDCQIEASEISGYHGQEARGFLEGTVRGGMRGAAVGAAGGWLTGNSSSKSAKRGAKLGAVIGGVRAAAKKNEIDEKRELYDRLLERCMARDSR